MNINDMTQMKIGTKMMQFSADEVTNKAKKDPAGLAISEKLEAEKRGLQQGYDNSAYMSDALNIADGGLSQINESLTDIRTLAIQANNSFLSDDDRAIIQMQVDQISQGINDVVGATTYNGMPLLDGSFTDKTIASNSNGTGSSVSIGDMTNIGAFDITSPDALDNIDKAISSVNSQRAEIGTTVTTNNYTMDSNSQTSLNLAAAKSRIVDANIPKMVTDKNTTQLLESYQTMMQSAEQTEMVTDMTGILSSIEA